MRAVAVHAIGSSLGQVSDWLEDPQSKVAPAALMVAVSLLLLM